MHARQSLLAALLPLLAVSGACAAGPAQQNVAAIAPPSAVQESAPPRSILFVGNSYFYFNDSLHNHVKRMIAAAGIYTERELSFKSATIGGGALPDHPIDHLLAHENLRVAQPFELVIMGGQSNAALTPERSALFAETAADYAERIRAAGGEPVLYMTHAYVPPHRLARADMIDDVAKLYIETGAAIDAQVIPVGLAFAEAYRRRPDTQLHKAYDGSHPSLQGTYLAAATVLASLYDVSPVGNSYDYFGAIDPADARFLQEVARDTAKQFKDRDRNE